MVVSCFSARITTEAASQPSVSAAVGMHSPEAIRSGPVSTRELVIEIVSDKTGSYNFSDLTNRPAAGQPASGNGGASVALSQVDIEDGTVATSALGNPASRSVYDHIDVSATDFGQGRNPHIKASAQLPGAGKDSLTFQGSGAPFAGVLTLTDAPLAGLSKFAGSDLAIDGLLSGSANVRSAGSVMTAQGKLDLKKATANGQTLGAPFQPRLRSFQ